jgi:hypothetical protein
MDPHYPSHDTLRWAFLNEEHWVRVACGRSSVATQKHLVRVHRSFGPIFTCHHYEWPELATLGALYDSTQPGCPGFALLWSGEVNYKGMTTGVNAENVSELAVAYHHGNFLRSLKVEGQPAAIYFLHRLLKERLHAQGKVI